MPWFGKARLLHHAENQLTEGTLLPVAGHLDFVKPNQSLFICIRLLDLENFNFAVIAFFPDLILENITMTRVRVFSSGAV